MLAASAPQGTTSHVVILQPPTSESGVRVWRQTLVSESGVRVWAIEVSWGGSKQQHGAGDFKFCAAGIFHLQKGVIGLLHTAVA